MNCYTCVSGGVWRDVELMEEAFVQLKHRFVLFKDGILYLRYHGNSKSIKKTKFDRLYEIIIFLIMILDESCQSFP